MSLSYLLTTASSGFSTSCARNHYNYLPITKAKACTFFNNRHRLVRNTSCEQKQFGEGKTRNRSISHRRDVLVGLGVLTSFASGLGSQDLMASGSTSQVQSVPEFGPQPRPLDSTIRALVPRPKRSQNKSGKGVEIIAVDGVEVPNNGPVRFDVYIAKPDGDQVGPDLGEYVGSLVDLARLRMGRNFRKMGLQLGITGLVEEIGAEDSEKLVVSLVPRTGEMIIGGMHIDYIQD